MAKPTHYTQPLFRKVRIPKVQLTHWKPVTTYTKYRWIIQAITVVSFLIMPQLRWLKLDFTNDQYWMLGFEVSRGIAIQAVIALWLGVFFINFIENYLVGRLLCGWICPWGLLNRLGLIINHKLRRQKQRALILMSANFLFSITATLVVLNWVIDLGTFLKPDHAAFGVVWGLFGFLVLLGFFVLHKLGFKFCEGLCPFGMYLMVVTQENSLRITFDTSRACVDCGLCNQVCPMELAPREMDFSDYMDGGFGQCILCGDCIDVCQIRMEKEELPPPLRWNTGENIIPLLPLTPTQDS